MFEDRKVIPLIIFPVIITSKILKDRNKTEDKKLVTVCKDDLCL